jgi:hypothetical protein
MDDSKTLTELNERFVDAFRKGSWELLQPILSPGFSYLDGATGELWPIDRYIANLKANPSRLSTLTRCASTSTVTRRSSRRAAPPGPVSSTATSTPTRAAATAGSVSTPLCGPPPQER